MLVIENDALQVDILALADYCRHNFKPFVKPDRPFKPAADLPAGLRQLLERLAVVPTAQIDSFLSDVNFAMLNGPELCAAIHLLAVYHNAFTLSDLADEVALNDFLATARSTPDVQQLSDVFKALNDFNYLFHAEARQLVQAFLTEMLTRRDDVVRRRAAIGLAHLLTVRQTEDSLLADADFVASVAAATEVFLSDDVTLLDQQVERLGTALQYFAAALVEGCAAPQRSACLQIVLSTLQQYRRQTEHFRHILLTIQALPLAHCQISLQTARQIVKNIIVTSDGELRLEALYTYYLLIENHGHGDHRLTLPSDLQSGYPIAEKYLYSRVVAGAAFDCWDTVKLSDMYVSNLSVATPTVVKRLQIDLMMARLKSGQADPFYTATHFSNVLKLSDQQSVQRRAGRALIEVFDYLSDGQKNDIAVELLLALEMQSDRYSKQIPQILGQLIMRLERRQLAAIGAELNDKVKDVDAKVALLILDVVAAALSVILKGNGSSDACQSLLKVVFNGLFHYDLTIANQAVRTLSRALATTAARRDKQLMLIDQIAKKVIVALTRQNDAHPAHLNKALLLNQICNCLAQTSQSSAASLFETTGKVAFFPGTYDPFSKAHLASAKLIRDLGFEVYLAVDEFSWSKRTQPNRQRRRIVEMSIAEHANLYVFPQHRIVNIANRSDLLSLKALFGDREVYLVMGSDVLINASAYRRPEVKEVINSFSHVVLDRADGHSADAEDALENAIARIDGDVIRLTLPRQVEHISSTQIRNSIDAQRDISALIEKKAQQYIYDRALYRHEPLFKDTLTVRSTGVSVSERIDEVLIDEIVDQFAVSRHQLDDLVAEYAAAEQPLRLLQIRDLEQGGCLIAFSFFHWLRSGMIYREFPSDKISYYIRNHAVGRIVVIDALCCRRNTNLANLEQILLTETLAFSLAKDYTYAIYKNRWGLTAPAIEEVMEVQGFIDYCDDAGQCIKVVDMSNPIILNLDCKSMIKAPYRDVPEISAAIQRARRKLQAALCRFNRASLVLSFDRTMMYEHLIKKICDANRVQTYQLTPQRLGDNMCVTYGDLFKRWRIPNTVTKALHSERFYRSDFQSYEVHNAPNYLDLDAQANIIKSFNRPVILVDDIFDKGYRLRAIRQTFDRQRVEIKELVTAILTGRGKAWLEMNDIAVKSAYYIPKVKFWFNEGMLYPFIGGDAVLAEPLQESAALQSINLILPYVFPKFLNAVPHRRIADFSQSCLESAMIVLGALEDAYLKLNGRGLTLKDLSAVLISPRLPYRRNYLHYDMTRSPVDVLRADAAYLAKIIDYYEANNDH